MLSIKDVRFSYDKIDRYHFTFDVKCGEIVAILGESGSGKSTLLNLIAGFLKPDSGTIMIDNQSIESLAVEKRPITILFQHHNLFEHLSVEKNISLGNRDASSLKIATILKELGLEGFMPRKVTELSGGQQQRVALARVLIRDKAILLLDEPFTGLDSKRKEEMLSLVKSITQENNLHTIMITHEESDTHIASDIYRMQDGKLS